MQTRRGLGVVSEASRVAFSFSSMDEIKDEACGVIQRWWRRLRATRVLVQTVVSEVSGKVVAEMPDTYAGELFAEEISVDDNIGDILDDKLDIDGNPDLGNLGLTEEVNNSDFLLTLLKDFGRRLGLPPEIRPFVHVDMW